MAATERSKRDQKTADPAKRTEGAEPAARTEPVKGSKRGRAEKRAKAEKPVTDETHEKAKDAISERRRPSAEGTGRGRRVAAPAVTPNWIAPLAVVLLIVGLIYLVTYYLSSATMPLPIGDWNLLVGFGVLAMGGVTLMFWK